MGSVQAVGVDITYAEYLDNVEWLALHYPNLQLYEDDSIRMAPVIYNRHGSIDILFIDTTHTYEQTMAEYYAYTIPYPDRPEISFLSDRAIICLDDLFRPGMDLAWEEMPQPKARFDFLHPSQSLTDGGFGVVWK
jgi:hypothetical protein